MNWFLFDRKWIIFYIVLISVVVLFSTLISYFGYEFLYKEIYLAFFVFVTWISFLPILIFSLFGIPKLSRKVENYNSEVKQKFLVIVPAYNEKQVILNSVRSLLKQENGKFHEARIVVAFNGVDETGKIAEDFGAEVITTPVPKCGKSKAIEYVLSITEPEESRYIIIIDADNVVEDDFLENVAIACQTNLPAYQCNHQPMITSKNWVSLGLLASYAASSRLFNAGRSRLLNSALLCGTGMVFREDVIRFLWTKVKTQTEDIEMNALLSIHYNAGVEWIQKSTFYDEKPDRIDICVRQRTRWMVGHTRCFYFYSLPLIKDFLTKRKLKSLEIFFYYMTPFSILLSAIWMFMLIPIVILGYKYNLEFYHGYPLIVTLIIVGYIIFLPALGYFLQFNDNNKFKTAVKSLLYSFYAIFFACFTWPISIFMAFINLSQDGWMFHTPHKSKGQVTK